MGKQTTNQPRSYRDGRVTVADIARLTDSHQSTLYRWKAARPKLYAALELAVRATRARELLS